METIVAGYDGSEHGERVLVRAAELAGPLEARLVVVSVGRAPDVTAPEPVLEPTDPALAPTPLIPTSGGPPAPPPARAPQPRERAEEQLLLERARGFLDEKLARHADRDLLLVR